MKKIYCTCGLAVLALAACSEDNSANAWENNPPPVAGVSSCSIADELSSSSFGVSSSDVAESSNSVERSSSSLFGLSSSGLPLESSSSAALSSTSELSSSSGTKCGEELWNFYYNQDYTVRTNACVGSKWPENAVADGRWVIATDNAEGGKSSVFYMQDSLNGAVPDSVMEQCDGVCGYAALEKGSLTYNPFVSIGFKIARDSSGIPVPVDVSNWNGICITYRSDTAPALELDLGDSLNKAMYDALPTASLPKMSTSKGKCLRWSDIKQPSWYKQDVKIDGETAAKQLVGVRFKIQALTGEKYDFVIGYIGAGDGTNYQDIPKYPAFLGGYAAGGSTGQP